MRIVFVVDNITSSVQIGYQKENKFFFLFDFEFWYVLEIYAYYLCKQINKVTLWKVPGFIKILYKGQEIWEQPIWNLGFVWQLKFIALCLDKFT